MRIPMMFRLALSASLVLMTAACLNGCYTPGGGMLGRTGGPQTYYSTELMQKTITMVDTRNGDVFFTIDIPPAKQLVFRFDKGEGDDPVHTPDLMYWEIMEQGTISGPLHNAMSVPNASSRKIDVSLRRGVKYAEENELQ